jgi:branched-chain amino acid aminotransferase
MAFALEIFPVSYRAKYDPDTKKWDAKWLEGDTITATELAKLDGAK